MDRIDEAKRCLVRAESLMDGLHVFSTSQGHRRIIAEKVDAAKQALWLAAEQLDELRKEQASADENGHKKGGHKNGPHKKGGE